MRVTARVNIELAKSANYIPMGFWVKPVANDPKKPFYRITDLGIPMVKVPDGTSLGYSVYVLNVDVSNATSPAAAGNTQWKLIDTMELVYIQQAFIERLWAQMLIAEGAEIGGFEIKNGLLQSKAKDAQGNPIIVLNGNDGSGNVSGLNFKWTSSGVEISGKLSSSLNGNRFEISPASRTLRMIDAQNRIVGQMEFSSPTMDGDDGARLLLRHYYQNMLASDVYINPISNNSIQIRAYGSNGNPSAIGVYGVNGYSKIL